MLQDLQKMRERTTAVESRISDVEDKMALLVRDTQSIARLARPTEQGGRGYGEWPKA